MIGIPAGTGGALANMSPFPQPLRGRRLACCAPPRAGRAAGTQPAIWGSRPRGVLSVNRFSTGLDRQQHAVAEAGCLRVFADKLPGKNADRPEPAACLDYLRPSDTLIVPSLDRLSGSLADLIQIVGTLRRPDNTVSSIARLLGVSRAHHLQVRSRGHHWARSCRPAARTGVTGE
jgi:Resolvase, N terminal domain